MTAKIEKGLQIGIFVALVTAVVGEEILCFIRSYSELWYTILIPGVVVIAFACVAYFLKLRWINAVCSAIVITGGVLLIGFPSYVMYLGLILGVVSLVAEAVELMTYLVKRKQQKN